MNKSNRNKRRAIRMGHLPKMQRTPKASYVVDKTGNARICHGLFVDLQPFAH
jgi:hypothetical protein